jgi:ABC-type siderophore export system fused ATPase/permease subunit
MEKARRTAKTALVASGLLTLVVLALGILIIAMSNGEANAQKGGVFLALPVFITLCVLDVVSFFALLALDIMANKKARNVSLWPYLLVVVLIAAFFTLPFILVGKPWSF